MISAPTEIPTSPDSGPKDGGYVTRTMLVLALDLAVIAIVVFCGWRGYKNGLIRGVFGVVFLVVSLFLASVAATAYSSEFKDMLSPFVGGIVDSALVEIIGIGDDTEIDSDADAVSNAGVGDDTDADAADTGFDVDVDAELSAFEEISENYVTTYTALRKIGLPISASGRIAEMTAEDHEERETHPALLSDLISDKLSSTIAFVAVFGIAFLLLAIVFTVAGNLIGFVFSLPGLKLLDMIAGVLFGIAKGLLIVLTLAAVVRYLGLLAPETLNGTSVLKYLVNNNLIANRLGI